MKKKTNVSLTRICEPVIDTKGDSSLFLGSTIKIDSVLVK